MATAVKSALDPLPELLRPEQEGESFSRKLFPLQHFTVSHWSEVNHVGTPSYREVREK